MENSPLPNGVDSETAFMLEVKVNGFLNKRIDGRREYFKGRTLQWVVDSGRYSLCKLISDLSEKISWGSSQAPKIWMFDKSKGIDVVVLSDAQIQEMFKTYQKEKIILLAVLVCDADGSSDCSNITPTFTCDTSEKPVLCKDADGHVGFDDEDMFLDDDMVLDEEEVAHQSPESDLLLVFEDRDVEEEPSSDNVAVFELITAYDPDNPVIDLNVAFPGVVSFRKALRHFAVKNQFEYMTLKTDKTRFIGKCAHDDCPWRIHASKTKDNKTFKVKVLPHEHTCPARSMVDGKMASQSWVADRVGNWLRKNPGAGATPVKNKLEDDYQVKVTYNKAWSGRKAVIDNIHGAWKDSFQPLFNFKAELERKCPGSIVEIDCTRVDNKVYFSKIFVALKPCIDGFLHGCRPYVGIDSTHLTGKYKGQLAAAVGFDGHNWLYPVAYGIFDTETSVNWTWFMNQLKRAIGSPPGFTISSDAGKGLVAAIASVYPDAEHRECMRHLMENFSKRFQGLVFDNHMWPASMAYTEYECKEHLSKIKKAKPEAIAYLTEHLSNTKKAKPEAIGCLKKSHDRLWCRSTFADLSKCDYVNNNISESFNSWIKNLKDLHVVDLVDHIRIRLMVLFDKRRKVGAKLAGVILPNVIKQLNEKSRSIGKVTINSSGDSCGEVNGVDSDGTIFRHVVDLNAKECSCREWQLSGKPCAHAIKFHGRLRRGRMEDLVHEYYSLDRFRAAYAGVISPMVDKKLWIKVDPGFNVRPPISKRPPGRPKKQRIPGCLEKKKNKTKTTKKYQCPRCLEYGHQERTCKEPIPSDTEVGQSINKRKRRANKK